MAATFPLKGLSWATLETRKEQKPNEGGGTRIGDMEKPLVKPNLEDEIDGDGAPKTGS
jgi:hypothetical protein